MGAEVMQLRLDVVMAVYDKRNLLTGHRVINREPLSAAFAAMRKGRGGEAKADP